MDQCLIKSKNLCYNRKNAGDQMRLWHFHNKKKKGRIRLLWDLNFRF